MKVAIIARRLGFAAVLLLFGCSASGSTTLPSLNHPSDAQSRNRKPWILAGSARHRLLYVSDVLARVVYIFEYPLKRLGQKPVGELTGFQQPEGLCSDTNGDVWVTDLLAHDTVEYVHGATTPSRTLAAPNGQEVVDCAVDPKSGDLAVTSVGVPDGQTGRLYVYRQARGSPHTYADQDITAFFDCGYDNAGNLFVDGQNQSGFPDANAYAELLEGSKAFAGVTMSANVEYPGGIVWHGTYWALEDDEAQTIYHLKIAGGTATAVGSTVLEASSNIAEFVIDGDKVVGTDGDYRIVQAFDYPAGGEPIKELGQKLFDLPAGIVISSPPPG